MCAEDFFAFFQDNLVRKNYIMEPYINSTTLNGNSFVLRTTLKRGSYGKFIEMARYVAITKGVVANINLKGTIVKDVEQFLDEEFAESKNQLIAQLKNLEKTIIKDFGEFEGREIFNFGIDAGIDRYTKGGPSIKLFELNTENVAIRDKKLNQETSYAYYRYLYEKYCQSKI